MATANLRGRQEPRILLSNHVGPFEDWGAKVTEFASMAGLILDPWQQFVVRETHKRNPLSHRLCYSEVGLIVPRQNGKGSILEAVELAWLFLSGEELIMHSAHEFKTAADAYRRLKGLIEDVPELDALVKKYNNSHGQEGIELHDGRQLKFIARTVGSGRGFPAKKIVLDESYHLKEAEIAAILPTLTAADDPQVWYTSTPVNKEYHDNGKSLARVRGRALKGEDDDLCYLEWSAPEDSVDYSDRDLWLWNPGLGYRIRESSLRRDYGAMSRKTFGVEHLGIGDWPDPDEEGSVLTRTVWEALEDRDSHIEGPMVVTVDVAPFGHHASVSVAGRRADGLFHCEVIQHAMGVTWVIPYLKSLVEKWNPLGLLYDPRAATAAMAIDLETIGCPVFEITGIQVTQAFAEFVQKVLHDKTIRHPIQTSVSEALDGAKTRNVGDAGITWDRKNATVDITGLVSLTNAMWYFCKVESKDVVGSVW